MSAELISAAMLEIVVREHYVSTACLHAEHWRCRKLCKFCDGPCRCVCHEMERITGKPVMPGWQP